jgi:hypothetical protein
MKRMKKRTILLIILLVITGGVVYALYLYNKPHQSIYNVTPEFKMEAKQLASEYEADENKADKKYLGKVIEVRGIVSEKLHEKGKIKITLEGADLAGVNCEFDPSFNKTTSAISEGQEIKIKGFCVGALMDVELEDCILANEIK